MNMYAYICLPPHTFHKANMHNSHGEDSLDHVQYRIELSEQFVYISDRSTVISGISGD